MGRWAWAGTERHNVVLCRNVLVGSVLTITAPGQEQLVVHVLT